MENIGQRNPIISLLNLSFVSIEHRPWGGFEAIPIGLDLRAQSPVGLDHLPLEIDTIEMPPTAQELSKRNSQCLSLIHI